MAIVINGSGTVTGLAVGGLPDGTVDSDTLASGIDKTSISDSGDATAITIDSSERVGIGTGSPTARLHVYNDNDHVRLSAQCAQNTGQHWQFQSRNNGEFWIRNETTGSNKFIMDSTGAITMPSQPCVSARAIATDIPINTLTVIPLDTERFDIGNNLASNTFTAPVTGKYLYTYTLYFSNVDTAASSLGVQAVTSNRQYESWITPDHIGNSDFAYTMTSSQIADMDANDTLQFKAYCGGGSAQTDIHADSHISIALIA